VATLSTPAQRLSVASQEQQEPILGAVLPSIDQISNDHWQPTAKRRRLRLLRTLCISFVAQSAFDHLNRRPQHVKEHWLIG